MDERIDMNKASDAEIELRIQTVAEMLIKAQGRENILRYCAENWGIRERQADNYISRAIDKIKKNKEFLDLEQEISLQKARFEDLYQKNYTIQDYREARQVLDSIAKLLGLNKPEKLDHTTKGESIQPKIEIVRPDASK